MNQLPLLADRTRIACVDVPALPLQLALRAHPDWQADPVVVVEDDRPLSPILWANRAARACKIRRGLPFGQAKTLSARLRAVVVPEQDIARAVDAQFDLLLDFSPYVEPVVDMPGLFWLDPTGLGGLFGDLATWAELVCARLRRERYLASVAVGFMRPFLFALCRLQLGARVLDSREAEQTAAQRVPLERLGVSPRLLDDMALLDIHTVGEFLRLPTTSLRVRYGDEVAGLHAFLSGKTWTPLQPRQPVEPTEVQLQIDPPDDDHTRLLFGLKNMLHGVVEKLSARSEAITALSLTLLLEHAPSHHERLESAAPTLDVVQLVDLLRLRLGTVALPARVEQVDLTVEHRRVHPRQLNMLTGAHMEAGAHVSNQAGQAPRSLAAANRALARLKATFGSEAVTRAHLRATHLPEGSFHYEPTSEVRLPQPHDPGQALPLVRRVFAPVALPPLPNHEPEAWLGHYGAVEHMFGPYRVAGGWWAKRRERDYYFIETKKGDLLWAFYDRPRRRWFLHGVVE